MNEKEKRKFRRLLKKVWFSKELEDFIDFLFNLNPEDTERIKVSFEYEVIKNEEK